VNPTIKKKYLVKTFYMLIERL